MSEIPFVNRLGDALDAAISKQPTRAPRLRRLGRRRYLAVALAALTVAGGGAAVATLSTDPVEIGFGNVACFEGTEPSGNIAIISDPTQSPVDLCAGSLSSLGLQAHELIACQWPDHGIVVVVRGDRGGCANRGLAPVPPSYGRARRRAVRLQALAMEFERGAGCLAPREFARRLTAKLRASGWPGWRAVTGGGRGPCGRVSVPSGSELRGSIGSSVDATRRKIAITGRAPLALEQVIYGADSPGVRLFDSSGERCFTMAALERHVRRAFADVSAPLRFRYGSMPKDQGIESPRGDRYAEGCAIYIGAYPAFPGGRTEIRVPLWQRGAG